MNSCTLLSILMCLVFAFPSNAQTDDGVDPPLGIGNLDGNEVIVHVYRNKEDPFPFIEFSVTVDESSGNQLVEVTEVKNRTTDGGFMIISGVKRAGDIGVKASERYEISFRKVGDYKIYEKAVMDYLRRLPVPEEEIEITAEDIEVLPNASDDLLDEEIDIVAVDEEFEEEEEEEELFIEEDTEEFLEEVMDNTPVPVSGIEVDSNSVIVHVHRNSEDVAPFKEFVLSTEMVNGEEKVRATEVTGLQPQGKFMIVTGFVEDSLGGVRKSSEYDVIPYNVYVYDHYEQAILDIMLKLTPEQFSGAEATISQQWEDELDTAEAEEQLPAPKPQMPEFNKRKGRKKEISQRDINKLAKQVEKAKYNAPKSKNKYGLKKSKRMSARMSGSKKKTVCPSFRGH